MTALLEYLDLLHNAWEAKLLDAKQFLTYHTHLIVLCIYPEKYMALASPDPRLSGPSRTIACWLRDAYKLTFYYSGIEKLFVRNRCL